MHLCYIDEAGCTGKLPHATSNIQPVLTVIGLILEQENLYQFTLDWLQLKKRFFPRLAPGSGFLDYMQPEIKGAELRKEAISLTRNVRRAAIGFLDHFFTLLEKYHIRLVGRVWIKGIGASFDGIPVYTSSIQSICSDFEQLLTVESSQGFVIADHRNYTANKIVSHSIFTQKFKYPSDDRRYPHIAEMPVFGHSDNHVGLQCADIVASAIITPIAIHSYCEGHVQNIHVKPDYSQLKARYAPRLKPLLHRYQEPENKWRGGITVSDAIRQAPSSFLLQT